MKKALVLLLFVISFVGASAQNQSPNYKPHSIFIFSFTRYVQWPEEYNQGDFEIVVLGDTPLTDELKAMAQSKKVGDRPIKVSRINSVTEIKKCHILFIASSKSTVLPEVITKVNSQSVLIVTEEPGMGAKGSIINFITKDGKLHFELNQSAVTRHNFKISNVLSGLAILI
jgi:hypothetical protein